LNAVCFIYGRSESMVEQINNTTGTVLYLHHDQQGSTRLLTGSTGKTEGAYSYSPYGVSEHTGTATTPLGYDGQYTSSDTGLIYMRAREYDPTTAQFLTVDPAVAITRAPYGYAGDNPVNEQDRTGLEEETLDCSPFGCISVPGGSGNPGQPVQEIIEKNWHEFEGGLEVIGKEVGGVLNEITGGGGSLPKPRGGDGKTHGEIPRYPPSGATREELEETLEDIEKSMPIREKQLEEKGEDKEHRKQLEEERELRRQIEEKLRCGS
jgi:RHS repeat-associated protein